MVSFGVDCGWYVGVWLCQGAVEIMRSDFFMTDREIMREAEKKVAGLVETLSSGQGVNLQEMRRMLVEVRNDIHRVTTSDIDYQVVVDNLDDNILIANSQEEILYVNPSYEKHTGITKEALIGHKVSDVLKSQQYFTVATVPDVLKRKEKVMKLAYMNSRKNPGIVVGVPIFDKENPKEIQYVVATNRGLSSYVDLRDNFTEFINTLTQMQKDNEAVHIYNSSENISSEHTMIGNGPSMERIRHFIENVSKTDATVLITGESGAGKELIADAIYKNSSRANMPFIKINCSSIPASLLESELFGYEKGAFSGASAGGKKGLFEAANNGTLLLDEIGDMPMELQAKLLRAIQSSEITRVGGTKPIKLNIRLIAATNCNLREKIANGTFRSDLYYRLHVIPVNVPPLRERKEDIPLLCRHYLNIFSERYQRTLHLSDENIQVLTNYSWPGNIRELRNIMEYLTVCCSDMENIETSFLYGIFDMDSSNAYVELNQSMSLNDAVSAYEKEYLKNTIKGVKNLKEASQLLDVDISTVSRKLKQYGLSIKNMK